MAPPTILLIGATGNTGAGVLSTLPAILKTSPLSDHRILATTRSLDSPSAKALTTAGIEAIAQNWAEITTPWLLEQNVERIFIAPHNGTNAFTQESSLHVAALNAGVRYVVRISTGAMNVRPDSPVFNARTHWAIEALLGSEAFRKGGLNWTSLQPNGYAPFMLGTAVGYIKAVKGNGGDQGSAGPLRLLLDENMPMGMIDPAEVGVFAAHLLSLPAEETAHHNGKKYILNGPEDISGADIVKLVEENIGTRVPAENVVYRDMSFLDGWVAATPEGEKSVIGSMRYTMDAGWEGKMKAEGSSQEVLEIAKPKRTARDVLGDLLREK